MESTGIAKADAFIEMARKAGLNVETTITEEPADGVLPGRLIVGVRVTIPVSPRYAGTALAQAIRNESLSVAWLLRRTKGARSKFLSGFHSRLFCDLETVKSARHLPATIETMADNIHREDAPEPAPQPEPEAQPAEAERFQPGDKVWITYPNSITADREARVVEDAGHKKVRVEWQTQRNTGRGARGGWVGNNDWREQRIPRERLRPVAPRPSLHPTPAPQAEAQQPAPAVEAPAPAAEITVTLPAAEVAALRADMDDVQFPPLRAADSTVRLWSGLLDAARSGAAEHTITLTPEDAEALLGDMMAALFPRVWHADSSIRFATSVGDQLRAIRDARPLTERFPCHARLRGGKYSHRVTGDDHVGEMSTACGRTGRTSRQVHGDGWCPKCVKVFADAGLAINAR